MYVGCLQGWPKNYLDAARSFGSGTQVSILHQRFTSWKTFVPFGIIAVSLLVCIFLAHLNPFRIF